jgi:FG-GAP repeat
MGKKIIFFLVCMMLIGSDLMAALRQQKLSSSDTGMFIRFGSSVSISADGNTIVVGVPFADKGSNADQGSTYIYWKKGGQWIQQQEITSSDGAAYDRFGWTVSINSDGNTIVVGAPHSKVSGNSEQGSAYVFVRNGRQWIQQQKLTVSDGSAGDRFGSSVSISGDGNMIVIGAPLVNIGNRSDQGSAYIFKRSKEQWTLQQKLTALDGSADDYFGQSVSINGSGNLVVSGAPEKNIDRNASQGSVYAFSQGLPPKFTNVEWSGIALTVFIVAGFLYYIKRRKKEKK